LKEKIMDFTGNEGSIIPLNLASQMTKNFRLNAETDAIISMAIGKNIIEEILNQNDCLGLRFYKALDENSLEQFVIVGVDTDGNDMYTGKIADRVVLCPVICPQKSPLNSEM
jgi:hypothetical protein